MKRKNVEYYLQKIKKIEKRIKRRYRPSPASSHSSSPIPDSECGELQDMDMELVNDDPVVSPSPPSNTTPTVTPPELEPAPVLVTESVPSTSPEVLQALGDLMPEKPKFGPALNDDLARIWNTILKNGLQKEHKQKLEKNVPENCSLLQAPLLNPEIVATVSDTIINRDKKIETEQNQLGLGLTILGDTLSMLINNDNIDRLKLISQLSDAGRVLTDLHSMQTKTRKNLIFPVLDKKFLEIVKDVDRDEYLYGNNLTEKIKVLKTHQRTGHSIKKPATPSTVPRQGNLSGPPRYNQQRATPRFGQKKPQFPYNKVKQFSQTMTARRQKAQPQEKTRVRR
ncbi:hypothetical protein PYW08_000004 [Mythimna loreyi]|uniref:Uncharacterized protein n=1 Tax=Mythimna loreyi TaxID=667449 RepID=A0ACC2RAS0_9NEOP|nr:hypothetical protein PYW08_000004 [Mythimna loreyi]